MPDLCKIDPSCSFVYPILEGESMGDSLSSINFNFKQLDAQLCNIETLKNTEWGPIFSFFSNSSANWLDAINVFQSNSACWLETSSTVNEMSSFWLKPITLVYPFPFVGNSDIASIRAWLIENFPINGGTCFNYIAGQEFYIFSPEYYSITRTVSESKGIGKQRVKFTYTCSCISQPSVQGSAYKDVDCGTYTLSVNVPDQYINKFVGIKFEVLPTLEWSNGTKIYE